MANAQRIAGGFPFPVYVNETVTKQQIAPGVYVNETIAAAGGTVLSRYYFNQHVARQP